MANTSAFYEERDEQHRALNDVAAFLDCARYDEEGDVELLQAYLQCNPSHIDAVDDQGRTAVHMAAANNHVRVLQALLDHGPQPDLPNYEGNTALHFAALNNAVTAARLLLERGWHATVLNANHKTPLQLIQDKGYDEMEVVLVSYDDSLESYVPQGTSAVHLDASCDHAEEEEEEGHASAPAVTTQAQQPEEVDHAVPVIGSALLDEVE